MKENGCCGCFGCLGVILLIFLALCLLLPLAVFGLFSSNSSTRWSNSMDAMINPGSSDGSYGYRCSELPEFADARTALDDNLGIIQMFMGNPVGDTTLQLKAVCDGQRGIFTFSFEDPADWLTLQELYPDGTIDGVPLQGVQR